MATWGLVGGASLGGPRGDGWPLGSRSSTLNGWAWPAARRPRGQRLDPRECRREAAITRPTPPAPNRSLLEPPSSQRNHAFRAEVAFDFAKSGCTAGVALPHSRSLGLGDACGVQTGNLGFSAADLAQHLGCVLSQKRRR